MRKLSIILCLISQAAWAQLQPPPQQAFVCGRDYDLEQAYVQCQQAYAEAVAADPTTAIKGNPLKGNMQAKCEKVDALWASHVITLQACPVPQPKTVDQVLQGR